MGRFDWMPLARRIEQLYAHRPTTLPLRYAATCLANVNSRSRSLYASARLSVVCMSSVMFVRPT